MSAAEPDRRLFVIPRGVLWVIAALLAWEAVQQMWRLDGLAGLLRSDRGGDRSYARLNLAYWCVFVCIGGFAAIQLCRLRRSGLVAAAIVSGTALTMGIAGAHLGLWSWESRIAPGTITKALILLVVVTPAAARATMLPVAVDRLRQRLRLGVVVCGIPGYLTLLILAVVVSERAQALERLWQFTGLLGLRGYLLHSMLGIYAALCSVLTAPIGVLLWLWLVRRQQRVSAQEWVLLLYVLIAGAASLPIIASLGVLGLQFR